MDVLHGEREFIRNRKALDECNDMFQCNGVGEESPMSLALLSLPSGSNGDLASYEVSLIDRINLSMTITPIQGQRVYPLTGCAADLLSSLSQFLAVPEATR